MKSKITWSFRLILGDPGAGKTTLLKHITLALAQSQGERLDLPREDRLPIFIRLYDYVAKRAGRSGDYSLLDYLYTQASRYYSKEESGTKMVK